MNVSHIEELHKKVSSLADDMSKKLASVEDGFEEIRSSRQAIIPARIERLEELLQKIDDYELKVKDYQELAKKNLNSDNVLSIEAPPGYRINLNRLKKLSLMIDPFSDNDPYAQRLLAVARCDEHFLSQKREEFSGMIEALRKAQEAGLEDELQMLSELKETAASLSDSIMALSEKLGEMAKK